MVFGYIRLPAMFGVGHYTVTVRTAASRAGCTASGNVTYRGTEVGRVTDVRLTDTGVEAVLSLRSDVHIPSDLDAQVHSVSRCGRAIRRAAAAQRQRSAPLKNGDVIPVEPHLGAAGHQQPAERRQPGPAGDPARQSEDRHR